MAKPRPSSLSGRRQQAARNDRRILEAARDVFLADPRAPISDVAKRAGVGISALYSRYAGKDELLRTLCANGLERYVDETEAALRAEGEAWSTFSDWMGRIVDADITSLTLALAGTFTPTPEMFALAERARQGTERVFERVRAELRPGIEVHDISVIFELLAALKLGERSRTELLRRRYLSVILDGLRAPHRDALPGPGPSWPEVTARWRG